MSIRRRRIDRGGRRRRRRRKIDRGGRRRRKVILTSITTECVYISINCNCCICFHYGSLTPW
jgi:hypothetical protein